MILSGIIKKFLETVQNLLVPEDAKIQKLLNLPRGKMRELLPSSPVYSRDIFVLFDYQNKMVRTLVKAIKYKNNAGLRKRIAGILYEEILDIASEAALFDGAPPLLLPMPMSKLEKRKRGFNQCEELVREIKKIAGDNIEISYNTLEKIRETERQTNFSREERQENVKNSMQAAPYPRGGTPRTIIVLDDVYTTGASLSEARRALITSGAKRVLGIFIAH